MRYEKGFVMHLNCHMILEQDATKGKGKGKGKWKLHCSF